MIFQFLRRRVFFPTKQSLSRRGDHFAPLVVTAWMLGFGLGILDVSPDNN